MSDINTRMKDVLAVVAAALNSIHDDTGEVLMLGEQTLSDDQKVVVRHNIGAASAADVATLTSAVGALTDAVRSVPSSGAAPVAADEDYAALFVGLLTNPTIKAAAQSALPNAQSGG